ncbi:MAG: lipid-A-disaccharide synthase [Muribaculaceae bacterium]|nr:lipid-A-disaccharide synthase [Muribaculaceae bacterium]
MIWFVSAGEASGDLHASHVMSHLRSLDPSTRFVYLGGDHMAAVADTPPLVHISQMSVMGIFQVVASLPRLLSQLEIAKKAIEKIRPDVVLLVDYPSFNLKLAAYAHSLGIPVTWYISPKVWVWKEWRVATMRKVIDRLFCILPFEPRWFQRRHDWNVEYVGNPSVSEIDQMLSELPSRDIFSRTYDLEPEKKWLALVPGSRPAEIKANLPIMLQAVRNFRNYTPVIAGVSTVPVGLYDSLRGDTRIIFGATGQLIAHSEAALVTSGTATLETALIGTPQVMLYRDSGSRVIYALGRNFLKVKYFSLPNLILGQEVIKELVMHFCTPEAVSDAVRRILPGNPGYVRQQELYRDMRKVLGNGNAPLEVAKGILKIKR